MHYSLDIAALPEGYGEALLPIAEAKEQLRVLEDDDDALIAAMRDAAIATVEDYTGLVLGPRTGLVWRAESLPRYSNALPLGVRPATGLQSAIYLDSVGAEQEIDVADLRIVDQSGVMPVAGASWPNDVSGGVVIEFDAGLAAGQAPAPLISAARLMLGTLYQFRETVVSGTIVTELPLGFEFLCRPFRRISL